MTSNPDLRRRHLIALAAVAVLLVVAAGCASGSRSVKAGKASTGPAASAVGVQPFSTSTTTPGSSATSVNPYPPGPPATGQPQPPTGTGAYGLVTAGPTCPVQRPGQPCLPRAVVARIEVHNPAGATVASSQSDSSGRYSIHLAPGSYTLVAVTGTMLPRCPSTAVMVTTGAPARVDIACDTGIR